MSHDDFQDLPTLRRLRHELQQHELTPQRRRRPRWPLAAVALAVAVGAGGTVAATQLIEQGAPVPSAERSDFDRKDLPEPGTSVLDGLRVADPDGSLPWALRLATSETGQTCYTPGQVRGNELGQIRDGAFSTLPEVGPQLCGDPSGEPLLLAVREAPAGDIDRTLVFGIVGDQVSAVDLRVNGQTRRLPISDRGGYLAVLPPTVSARGMEVTAFDGTRVVRRMKL